MVGYGTPENSVKTITSHPNYRPKQDAEANKDESGIENGIPEAPACAPMTLT